MGRARGEGKTGREDGLTNGSVIRLPKNLRQLLPKHHRSKSYVTYCISQLPGGRRAVFKLLELFSSEPDAAAVLNAIELHGDKIPLDELLEKAEVEGEDFLVLVTRLLTRIGGHQASMIAAASYPHMMAASAQKAMDPEKGTDERRMHFEHRGFVQPRGGIKIGIKNTNNAGIDVPDEPAGPGQAENFDRTARTVVRNLPAHTE